MAVNSILMAWSCPSHGIDAAGKVKGRTDQQPLRSSSLLYLQAGISSMKAHLSAFLDDGWCSLLKKEEGKSASAVEASKILNTFYVRPLSYSKL
jgi:hypothetical protein